MQILQMYRCTNVPEILCTLPALRKDEVAKFGLDVVYNN